MTEPDAMSLRILIVEDEPFIRTMIRRMLRNFGSIAIREVSDGNEALDLIAGGYRPDLLLCDVQMRPMDGITFMRRLRADPDRLRASIPAVILTGAADPGTVVAASELGACSYLLKPVSPKLLGQHVTSAFRRKDALPLRGSQSGLDS